MRHYLTALRVTAITGLLIGAGVGLRDWSPAWPGLSLAVASRPAAFGWLIGLCLSPLLGWAFSRRRVPEHHRAPSRWQRALSVAISVVAVAPAALWLLFLLPIESLRPATASSRAPEDTRPNLILITIDALRADHLGIYGNDNGLTPNLDAFAAEATRYDSAYASSPWTLTSFASIFSSLPPSQCGLKVTTPRMHDWYLYSAKLPDSVELFHEQLHRDGYVTAAELTNCFLTRERGWGRGFDSFRNEDGPELGAILTRADTITENGLSWLRLNRHRPFFLWLHYLDPHVPYNSPDTPGEVRGRYPSDWLTRREYWYGNMERGDEETKARYQEFCREMYAEEVRFADRWVGDLLAGIEQAGLWDSSLIVITSDHGEELFDHGGFEHGHTMHDELLRVPLLVKWPGGVEADARVSRTVGTSDLAATFLSLAGSEIPPSLQGDPLPRQEGPGGGEVYSEGILHGLEQVALTTDSHRVIWRPKAPPYPEALRVYDRESDPGEQADLSDTGTAADLRERLKRRAEAALQDSHQWKTSNKQEFQGIDLSDATREKLRTLGYIGE